MFAPAQASAGVAELHSVESFISDTSLFEDNIRHITRTDVRIDDEFMPVDGTVPKLVIALPLPKEVTLVGRKNLLKARRVARHLRRVWQLDPFLSGLEIEHDLNVLTRF